MESVLKLVVGPQMVWMGSLGSMFSSNWMQSQESHVASVPPLVPTAAPWTP